MKQKNWNPLKFYHAPETFPLWLKWSLRDALFFSVMVGFGETYILAFAVKSGVKDALVGILGALPLLGGATLQMVSPWAVAKLKSFRRWVIAAAVLQGFAFLPLLYAAFTNSGNFWLILFSAMIYWASGFATSPAWNTWMTYQVPKEQRSQFFVLRHRLGQTGILGGIVAGGLVLQWIPRTLTATHPVMPFAILFFGALVTRLVSVYCLLQQEDRQPNHRDQDVPSLWYTLKSFGHHAKYRSLFLFLFLFNATVFISANFVTPYMFSILKFSYGQYMAALAFLLFGKLVTATKARQWIEEKGVSWVFVLGACGTSPLPALWSLSENFYYILALQFVSGALWSCFEVSLMLIFFNHIEPKDKTATLTLYNVFNSSAIVLGSAFGAQWLHRSGMTKEAYHTVFIAGAFLRVLASLPLLKVPTIKIQNVPFIYRLFGAREGFTLSLRAFLDGPVELEGDGGPGLVADQSSEKPPAKVS